MITELTYPFSLPPLPYSYDALEPYIDAETMHFHHDKHFQTYIDNLNTALKDYPEYQSHTLTQLLTELDRLPRSFRLPREITGAECITTISISILWRRPDKNSPFYPGLL